MDNLGICVNCSSVGSCTFRSGNSKPVWYCNEYKEAKKSSPPNLPTRVGNSDSSPETYRGLCVNCERLGGCNIALSTGGVWHCNEYI